MPSWKTVAVFLPIVLKGVENNPKGNLDQEQSLGKVYLPRIVSLVHSNLY